MLWDKNKKASKWLVKDGRKVRCYLCGKKISADGQFEFNPESRHYFHVSCGVDNNSKGSNERRQAVKKIAVGAGIAGALAVGINGIKDMLPSPKYEGIALQSQNDPSMGTILTEQGLILPALTSDPANPVPGQMWYRSDAGVIAHFDSIQNRVVYSSEINDGDVHVTDKGISNGLSVLPNDGTGGFGPDTTLNTASRSQTGPPYTNTYGWQEVFNYIASQGGGSVYFKAGVYDFTNAPVINAPSSGLPCKVYFPVISGYTGSNFTKMNGVKFIFETPYWFNNLSATQISPSNYGYGVMVYDNQPSPSSNYSEILFDSTDNSSLRSMIELETEGTLTVLVPLSYVNAINFGNIAGLDADTFVVGTISVCVCNIPIFPEDRVLPIKIPITLVCERI